MSGVPLSAAPASSASLAAAIVASREELELGRVAYERTCATCHGAQGQGAVGPMISGRNDLSNIARVIAQGQGEMPTLASSLTPSEIDAIAKRRREDLGAPRAPTRVAPAENV